MTQMNQPKRMDRLFGNRIFRLILAVLLVGYQLTMTTMLLKGNPAFAVMTPERIHQQDYQRHHDNLRNVRTKDNSPQASDYHHKQTPRTRNSRLLSSQMLLMTTSTNTSIGTIVRFEVINTVTGTKIEGIDLVPTNENIMSSLEPVIVLSRYGLTSPSQLNFIAITTTAISTMTNTSNNTIKSIRFTMINNITTTPTAGWIDNVRPFAACGNNGTDYFPCGNNRLSFGSNTVTATPYSRILASGTSGQPVFVSFTISLNEAPCTIPQVSNP
jgi:hypothetical protein